MARYDDTFVDRFLEPWNRDDVDGALALITDEVQRSWLERYGYRSARKAGGAHDCP
jgi:hypothetical protein